MGQILGKKAVKTGLETGLGRIEYSPTECMALRAEMSRKIKKYLTFSDRKALIQGMENPPNPTPDDMAVFYAGGKDCLHKNVTPGDQDFLDRLPVMIEKRIQEEQQKQQEQQQQQKDDVDPTNDNGSNGSGSSNGGNGATNAGVPTTSQEDIMTYGAYGLGAVVIIGSVIALAS